MIRPMNRLILFLIGIVLVGVAGFALIWFGVGRELNKPTIKILMDLRDGKHADVHQGAHASFRERQSVEELGAYWAWWAKELGTFVEVTKRMGVSMHTSDAGSFRGITMEVGFMKGKARAKFRYETSGDDPLLTHFRISMLEENAGEKEDRVPLEGITRRLFDRYDASDWTGLYAGLGFQLQQAWPLTKVNAQMPPLRAQRGQVKKLRLTKTDDDPDDDVVVQHYDAEFEHGKGSVKVSFQYDNKRWHVVTFVIK